MQGIIAGLVMVSTLVIVHEAGHFLVAKLFGIGAPVFSIGIGPRLFGFRALGTDWRVSGLPLGGYVRLAGADPFGDEDPDDVVPEDQDFMRKPVWQRLLVMAAGPGASLLLPYVLFTGALMLGEPQPDNTIGAIEPGTVIAGLGLREGDRIVRAAGTEIEVWPDLLRVLDDSPRSAVSLEVERDGAALQFELPAGAVVFTSDGLVDTGAMGMWQSRRSSRLGVSDTTSPAWKAGLRPGDAIVEVDGAPIQTWAEMTRALVGSSPHHVVVMRPTARPPAPTVGEALEKDLKAPVPQELTRVELDVVADPAWSPSPGETAPHPLGLVPSEVFVGEVMADSAASEAGVARGDRLLFIDDRPIRSWADVVAAVGATRGVEGAEPRPLELSLIRDGQPLKLQMTPRIEREVVRGTPNFRPLIGLRPLEEGYVPGPTVQKYYSPLEAFARAAEEGTLVFNGTLRVLGNLLTGDLKFSESVGGPVKIFRAAAIGAESGIFTYVRMMGSISFSLGIINLLPVPLLDGGQITLYAIEGLRGRPLPMVLRERIQMVGFLILASLMLAATVYDVSDWISG